jgi:hypothetical protein
MTEAEINARLEAARRDNDVAMVARCRSALEGNVQQLIDAMEIERIMGRSPTVPVNWTDSDIYFDPETKQSFHKEEK